MDVASRPRANRRSLPERLPVLVDGAITVAALQAAAARIDADADRNAPHMTAVELVEFVEFLEYYVKPAGYGGRGRPRRR